MLCPISYMPCDRGRYSSEGLRMLSPKLLALEPFPYTRTEAVQKAADQKVKMSISGAQPKLGAKLSVKKGRFEITTKGGAFILKPDNPGFVELPANEAATMYIARAAGIKTPVSGMVYDKDGHLIYFVKRFDRTGRKKHAVEDFSQLLGLPRDSKYNAKVEDLVEVVNAYASFPVLEMERLFRVILFNFLTGNEDAHAKNFSLVTTEEGVVRLSPAYDLVNTTIAFPGGDLQDDETAIPLAGKMTDLTREDLEVYLGQEVMGLSAGTVHYVLRYLEGSLEYAADFLFAKSFLSDRMKLLYLFVLAKRRLHLGMNVRLPLGEHRGYLHLEEYAGKPMGRLEVQGMNMLFTPPDGAEKQDGQLVTILSRAGGLKLTSEPSAPLRGC